MKDYINKSKIVLALLAIGLLTGISACDVSDPDLPFDLDGTLNNNGAYLRVLGTESAAFDLADPQNASFIMTVEYYDGKEQPALEDVDFYASYTGFTLTPGADPDQVILDETTEPVLTVPASAFSPNEDGLLQTTIEVPLTTVASALGIGVDEVGVEDRFGIRWAVNTTEGRTFSEADRSQAVAGGFYNSPYFSNVFTVQALAQDQFVGEYQFVQQAIGPLGPAGVTWLFGETFTAELSVDPNNSLNGRIFTSPPVYPLQFGLPPVDVPISLGRTATISSGDISLPLGCSVGISFGAANDDLVLIDVSDDSQFTLVIAENTSSDCGAGPGTITFEVTKL